MTLLQLSHHLFKDFCSERSILLCIIFNHFKSLRDSSKHCNENIISSYMLKALKFKYARYRDLLSLVYVFTLAYLSFILPKTVLVLMEPLCILWSGREKSFFLQAFRLSGFGRRASQDSVPSLEWCQQHSL